jgi:antitoxin HicB
MLVYPVELKDDDGTVLVEFPDVPEAITYGDDCDEALIHAVDALETMLWSKTKDKEPIALPSFAALGKCIVIEVKDTA